MDYMILVNKQHPLPEGWEKELETVTITNSFGYGVEAEKKTAEAYLRLKKALEEDGIRIDLDSGLRTVESQREIMVRFTEKYGAEYALKTVAPPGCSEHHTGLALDLYFRIEKADGTLEDVDDNEESTKPEYDGLWAAIHARLAEFGFILRYPKGKESITGYDYEPWHIRYLDDAEAAKAIMAREGLTLEEWFVEKNGER